MDSLKESLRLGIIGNCTVAALVDEKGRIVWSCMPRLDGDPVFCKLLDGGPQGKNSGYYDIEIERFAKSEQHYIPNSAVLETTLYDEEGNSVKLLDFCPRYEHYGRIYRPPTIVRKIIPHKGAARVRIRLRPRFQYGELEPVQTRGGNHIRYISPDLILRLTTNAPISYIHEEAFFALHEELVLVLGPDEPLTRTLQEAGRSWYEQTLDNWRRWVRSLSLPFEWQQDVIRAAITLKMCTYEESGATVAALTTSIPESPDSGRNWDYRYCWIRDSYFTVNALNRLGATETMEGYIRWMKDAIHISVARNHFQPMFGLTHRYELIEHEMPGLRGYRGMGPVRTGNGAYVQQQNDFYGSAVLAVAHSFFDERLVHTNRQQLFQQLEVLGERAYEVYNTPDAGIWELRNSKHIFTFSAVTCWVACDRLSRIARYIGLPEKAKSWGKRAEEMKAAIMKEGYNGKIGAFTATFGGEDMDASLLLMSAFQFVDGQDPRFIGTINAVEKELRRGNHLFRYATQDDFGYQENAFNICTFWFIDALISAGRKDEAREMFNEILSHRTPLGLLSEDLDVKNGELWGNFPQTYSMVGIINAAMRLSPPWEEAF